MVVTENNILVHPPIQHILRGTTMVRVMELAEKHGIIKTEVRMIKSEEVNSAKELFIVGTTHDILPVTTYNNKPVNDGKVGPMAQKLLEILRNDQI